ncbi:acyl-CoA thioesterase-1 [Rhodobacter aestuarii]|uniref:Acyl-CoA thioesterase-1 n=1 Tax=Rhodobacter aestuarii TaxID=453582 RepID=A0A1N7PMH5_9RHOB|nr:arylesterase [Rhodobacter aestuarii]PTV94294.1 acyl-CoA thioesterase-1 [Rhodobacter aestuarii]SIT11788.1 acyl-CoA thioesterase-1 [Rhodobacter aestuarii]
MGKALAAGLVSASLASTAAAEPITLLAVGDSLTQGYGLNPGEGLVPQLQGWLQARGADVNVINAGVSGDTTSGGRARLGWSLTPEVDAVMIALGGNDMLRGQPPAKARENLDAMLAEVTAKGLPAALVGLQAPGNYGAAYQEAFNAIWPELGAQYGAVVVDNLLGPIAAQSPEERAAQGLMQADGIHPSAKGVVLVVEALGPKVLELLDRVTPDS